MSTMRPGSDGTAHSELLRHDHVSGLDSLEVLLADPDDSDDPDDLLDDLSDDPDDDLEHLPDLDAFDDVDAGHEVGARPVLADELDLIEHLCDLVGPDRFGRPALWVSFVDAQSRPLPVVVAIDDLPDVPDRRGVEALLGRAVVEALEYSGEPRAILAIVRRGGGSRTPFEARWARALREGAATYGLPVRAIVAIGATRSAVLPG
jgi:hypothetical protein